MSEAARQRIGHQDGAPGSSAGQRVVLLAGGLSYPPWVKRGGLLPPRDQAIIAVRSRDIRRRRVSVAVDKLVMSRLTMCAAQFSGTVLSVNAVVSEPVRRRAGLRPTRRESLQPVQGVARNPSVYVDARRSVGEY